MRLVTLQVALLLLLAGCFAERHADSPVLQIRCAIGGNGQGCGGGGSLFEKPVALVRAILERYETKGVTEGLGRNYRGCAEKHPLELCKALQLTGPSESEVRVAWVQGFFTSHASELLAKLNSTPLSTTTDTLYVTNPQGQRREVSARFVPDTGIQVNQRAAELMNLESFAALLIHELGHAAELYDDYIAVPGFAQGSLALDFAGASAIADSMNTKDDYRDLVLSHKDSLIAYYPFSEVEGSTKAANWVKRQPFGVLEGTVVHPSTGTHPQNSGFTFGQSGFVAGSLPATGRVSVEGLSPVGSSFTAEFWMKMAGEWTDFYSYSTLRHMPFVFDTYSLWMYGGSFGFNTNRGDIYGVEARTLAQKWVHVAAVFVDRFTQPDQQELYINGEKLQMTARRGDFSEAGLAIARENARILGNLSIGQTNGNGFTGQIDEVALYNSALDAETVNQHFKSVRPSFIQKGTAQVNFAVGASESTQFGIDAACAQPVVILNSQTPRTLVVSGGLPGHYISRHSSPYPKRVSIQAALEGNGVPTVAQPVSIEYTIECPSF